jgi:hypothetical protein
MLPCCAAPALSAAPRVHWPENSRGRGHSCITMAPAFVSPSQKYTGKAMSHTVTSHITHQLIPCASLLPSYLTCLLAPTQAPHKAVHVSAIAGHYKHNQQNNCCSLICLAPECAGPTVCCYTSLFLKFETHSNAWVEWVTRGGM